jgi:hypothetical protein
MLLVFLGFLTANCLSAGEPTFDLAGPKVDVRVKRGEVTLPISQVPYLVPGDRLWIHPDFPGSQSARYVLIVAFLRGATNPPPPEWFTRVETWNREAQEEGVFVSVPAEAEQGLIFLAPETGGDFSTLRSAVRGRPGTFVRATQDLRIASLDRMRLDAYLAEVKAANTGDTRSLRDHAELAARSLGIKIDPQCFDKPADQQMVCLTQTSAGLVMDDTNVQSLVNQLASGSTLDLVNQIGASSMAGGGAYSPYFGAVVDTAKILASLHTAHFQYIPALAMPIKDTLNLKLNMPPSFRDPKSVVVVALPPVEQVKAPAFHALNSQPYCLQTPSLVLPTESGPVFYATEFAHEYTLHIEGKRSSIDVPVTADASQGGFVLTGPLPKLPASGDLTGTMRGKWGFDDWEGPRFRLRAAEAGKWTVAAGDQTALVVGREDTLHIDDDSSLCVDRVDMLTDGGNPLNLVWKSPKPESLEVVLPMKDGEPGPVTLEIYQHGLEKPDRLSLNAYDSAASLERLILSAGDTQAQLKGTRLDQVARAEFAGINWTPAGLTRVQDLDQLVLTASGPTASLEPGKRYVASVELRDGRKLKTPVNVNLPRPQVTLLSKGSQQDDPNASPLPVHLGGNDDIALDGRLVFFLRSRVPANFPRNEKVEVAAVDGSFGAMLSLSDNSLILEDSRTAVGTLEPLKRFGDSAFGPIQVRAVSGDGINGDWLPLGVLVRVPTFKELRCAHASAKTCTLGGMNLFLANSIAATPEFDNATDVPPDFTGTQLTVPRPASGTLYLKLRDDPSTVQTLTLPVTLPTGPAASQQVVAQAPAPAVAQTPAAVPVIPPETHPATHTAPTATQQP